MINFIGNQLLLKNSCFIIVEAGVNHNGSLETALQLIDVAADAGADAIKFQTFDVNQLVTVEAPKADYQVRNTDNDDSQYEMLKRLALSLDDHKILFDYCKQKNIVFLSTPFDKDSADLLDRLGVVAFKIPSGEITNHPFLEYVARKGKPLIISTGMATLGDVEQAVEIVESTGNESFVLLHCVSNYPADAADVNLRAMQTLKTAFGKPVGYSDHTLGIEVALAAVALGANVVEKHLTLDRSMSGPDHKASLEPNELVAMIQGIRKVELALGDGRKRPVAREANTAAIARKSLVAALNLSAGTTLTEDMIAIKRPGTGLPPIMHGYLVGRILKQNVKAGTLLGLDMVS